MKNRSYLAFLGQRYERMGGGEKTKDVLNNYLCNEWNKNYANIEYVLNFLCLDIFWQKIFIFVSI